MSSVAPIDRIDYTRIVAPKIQYFLFNGGDEPVRFMTNGVNYTVPPCTEMASKRAWGVADERQPYPEDAAAGVLPLGDQPGWYDPRDPEKQWQQTKAEDILRYAVGDNGTSGDVGPMGIRPLTGRPDLDERIKADSTVRCFESKYVRCKRLRDIHLKINAKLRAEEQPPLAPSEATMRAMEYVALADSGKLGAVPLAKFQCPICAWACVDQFDLNKHLGIIHPDKASSFGVPGAGVGFSALSEDEKLEAMVTGSQGVVSKAEYDDLKAQLQVLTKLVAGQVPAPQPEAGKARKGKKHGQ